MNERTRILAINGSYRDDGITDQAMALAVRTLQTAGAEVETVLLRDRDIKFCTNCRACTQEPGEAPGKCVLHDSMHELIDKIEQADGYILAAPTNFGSVTALFKRFMERLVVYAYWPWDANYPKFRKAGSPKKKALLISSCAAPGILGRLAYGTRRQLKAAAATIGAESIGTVFVGLISKDPGARLPDITRRRTEALAQRLA